MAINFIRGNILSDSLVRGSNLSFQSSSLARDVLFVDVVNGNVGVNTAATTHTLTIWGNCNIRDTVEAGNLETSGDISATGNITGNIGNFEDIIVGNIDLGNLISGGNLQVESITSNTFVSAVGNVMGGNISTTGNVEGAVGVFDDIIVGNIDLGNLISGGNLQVESLSSNTYVSAIGNITGGNLLTDGIVSALGNITSGSNISATGNISGGNITTTGDISAAGNISAANFSSTGNVSLGNLTVANTTISTSLANGNITLTPTGDTLVIIDTVTGLVIPVGNVDQRPTTPLTGTLRFNSDTERMEIYDGAEWDSVTSEVTNQILYGDNSTQVFTLDRSTTAAAVLIMFNGVVQLPNVAYTVAGNAVTFAQPPAVSDVIDVRFL
jgi:hypothetical protein